jgi:hypothetical protein
MIYSVLVHVSVEIAEVERVLLELFRVLETSEELLFVYHN